MQRDTLSNDIVPRVANWVTTGCDAIAGFRSNQLPPNPGQFPCWCKASPAWREASLRNRASVDIPYYTCR